MKVHLRKMHDGTLNPADQESVDWCRKQKIGSVVYADFKKARNYVFHKKYFGMLNLAFENQEQFPTLESLRQAVQIAAGYYDTICYLDGRKALVSKSIAFGSMSAEEFEKLYSAVLDVIIKHFGFGEEFEIEMILQFG